MHKSIILQNLSIKWISQLRIIAKKLELTTISGWQDNRYSIDFAHSTDNC